MVLKFVPRTRFCILYNFMRRAIISHAPQIVILYGSKPGIEFNLFEVLSISNFQVMQGLAKSIAWDGEGATCLIEVCI